MQFIHLFKSIKTGHDYLWQHFQTSTAIIPTAMIRSKAVAMSAKPTKINGLSMYLSEIYKTINTVTSVIHPTTMPDISP